MRGGGGGSPCPTWGDPVRLGPPPSRPTFPALGVPWARWDLRTDLSERALQRGCYISAVPATAAPYAPVLCSNIPVRQRDRDICGRRMLQSVRGDCGDQPRSCQTTTLRCQDLIEAVREVEGRRTTPDPVRPVSQCLGTTVGSCVVGAPSAPPRLQYATRRPGDEVGVRTPSRSPTCLEPAPGMAGRPRARHPAWGDPVRG